MDPFVPWSRQTIHPYSSSSCCWMVSQQNLRSDQSLDRRMEWCPAPNDKRPQEGSPRPLVRGAARNKGECCHESVCVPGLSTVVWRERECMQQPLIPGTREHIYGPQRRIPTPGKIVPTSTDWLRVIHHSSFWFFQTNKCSVVLVLSVRAWGVGVRTLTLHSHTISFWQYPRGIRCRVVHGGMDMLCVCIPHDPVQVSAL